MKEIIRQKTGCFTGHRLIPIDHLESVKACTEIQIRRLILKHGIRYFGVGGAIGYDTLAAEILFRLRETDFPHIKVILVYPFEGFTSRWNDNQRAAYARLYPKIGLYSALPFIAPNCSLFSSVIGFTNFPS